MEETKQENYKKERRCNAKMCEQNTERLGA